MKCLVRSGGLVALLLVCNAALQAAQVHMDSKESKSATEQPSSDVAVRREVAKVTGKVSREGRVQQRAIAASYAKDRRARQNNKAQVAASNGEKTVSKSAVNGNGLGLDKEDVARTAANKKAEEATTITIKAADGSTAKVALAWLLALPFNQEQSFDDMHQNEGIEPLLSCVYEKGSCSKRAEGCSICDAVAQAWFKDIATKAQLDAIVGALRSVYLVYAQVQQVTPRGMANYFVLKQYAEQDLKTVWVVASRLGLFPFATAIAKQLRTVCGDVPTEKAARAAFVEKHALAQPLIEQMEFEHAYADTKTSAEGKVPELSMSMLCMYSFLPMNIPYRASADKVFAMIKDHPLIERLMRELPVGKTTLDLWRGYAPAFAHDYAQAPDFFERYQKLPKIAKLRSGVLEEMEKLADQKVYEKGFDATVFNKIPEGHFKLLIRGAYQGRTIGATLDSLPIASILKRLQPGVSRVDLHGLKLTDVSWLAEELYYMNDDTEIESLDLSGNSLTTVPSGMLTYCPALANLFFRNNMLTALPKDLLRPCLNFKKLDLRFNQNLKQLPADFYVPRGAKVYVG